MVLAFTIGAAPSNEQSQRLKADGTPDMGYSASQDAIAASQANANLPEAAFNSGKCLSLNCFVLILIH
jgi:hypothetical protein